MLQEVGKFRVVSSSDLAEFVYGGNAAKLERDLTFLQEKGLIQLHVLNARRDGRVDNSERIEAVTLSRAGQKLLSRSGEIDPKQKIYSDLVKPREAEHDAQIYRAYRKELEGIDRSGGRNIRVKLDFELKAAMNRAVYLAGKAQPDRDKDEVKAEIAQQLALNLSNNKVVVPDLRIEYDVPGGGSTHVDVEVATAAYRHGNIAAKSQAGFKIYMSSGDIGRLGGAIQDDHDIMSEILSL